MKLLTTLLLLAVLPVTVAATPASQRPSADIVDVVKKPGKTSPTTITPGDCLLNRDNVNVCNSTGSNGDFTIDPKFGSSSSATTVEAKNDAEGAVEGLDGNDTVNCANGSDVTISGTGGTVNAGNGSSGSVTNTGSPGGASITVNMSGGGSFQVPPGASIPFQG